MELVVIMFHFTTVGIFQIQPFPKGIKGYENLNLFLNHMNNPFERDTSCVEEIKYTTHIEDMIEMA